MAAVVHALRPDRGALPALVLDPDEDGSLAEVMREVGAAMEADALIVAWQARDGGEPVVLFADGIDADDYPARLGEPVQWRSVAASGSASPFHWRVGEGCSAGGELAASIGTDEGVVTIVGRFDRLGSATRVRAKDAAARLLPLIRPFVRLWAARRSVLSRVRGLTAAMNQSDIGTLLVNRHGHFLFANTAAETLLAEGDGIRRQGRLLSGGELADTLRLQSTIEHVITARDGPRAGKRAPVVALARKGRRPLFAAVIASDTAAVQSEESAAIIYLCDPEQDLTGLVEPICKLYGLSPVETRLASHLAKGVSLGEAAEAMHVREQTARSYLKQIFLKTDTRRQAELVWLILKSSVHAA